MEQIQPQPFNHNLDKVLKSYQTVAMSSLGGPSSFNARWAASSEAMAIARKLVGLESAAPMTAVPGAATTTDGHMTGLNVALIKPSENIMAASPQGQPAKKSAAKYLDFDPLLHPPPFPIQQMPVFTPIDQSSGEKCETVLENETISCFIVGGEKRLCLPQILNSVLRDFSLQQINAICEDLHIYCSRCSPDQLEILKFTGILPASAPSCGLITKTDAERLCNMLLYGLLDTKQYMLPSPRSHGKHGNMLRENCIPVYHECFGKCRGVVISELYISPHSPCIECSECKCIFSPQKFVMHSHKGKENRTCHWGFDSANWRSYVLVSRQQETDEKYQAALADMKAKFDFMSRFKRKHAIDENSNPKKIKLEDEHLMSKDAIVTSAWSADGLSLQRPSAFRPWSPSALCKDNKGLPEHGTVLVRDSRGIPTYLSMGPPVLLNPERVVPHTAASNFDSHYAPNVTLAPPSKPETPLKSDGTDSKDSSSESRDRSPESPDSPTNKRRRDEDVTIDTSIEQEIEMVRSMLEGDVVETRAGREKLLHELARIRMRQEERLQNALVAKKDLQQELEFVRTTKKEKLREAAETKRNLRKENERLRTDYERKLRELNDSKQHLKNEVEMLRNRKGPQDAGKERARLRAENDYMRERLDAVEGEKEQLMKCLAERNAGEAGQKRVEGTGKVKVEKDSTEGGLEPGNCLGSPKTPVHT